MINNLFDLTGKKALVTGATRGLGKAMAEGLMETGAEAVIVGTSAKTLDVAAEFSKKGFKCHGIAANLAEEKQVLACWEKSLSLFDGHLDILLTAHGIQRRHMPEDFPISEWNEIISVNLTSVFLLCQQAG